MNIKLKILLFALVAVLMPFFTLGYFAYTHSVQINKARFGQELLNLGGLVARQTGRRLDGLRSDVAAFAVSSLLQDAIMGKDEGLRRSEAYFAALRSRFPDFRRFLLTNKQGLSIGADASGLPRLTSKNQFGLQWSGKAQPVLRVTVPVTSGSGTLLGYLVAEIDFKVLASLLENTAGRRLYLASGETRFLDSKGLIRTSAPISTATRTALPGFDHLMLYPDHLGVKVLGLMVATQIDELRVLVEMDAETVFAELSRLKTRALWILLAVLAPLMLVAYLFATSLARSLNRLIEGARRVAAGDLEVELPSERRDEIGYLSRVFNDMVERLQDSRCLVAQAQSRLLEQNQRLEQLSVTDNLTGLANRRSLTENLARYLARYRRNGLPFSVLMLDIDHFKRVNDRYGHLAGDAVLSRFAARLAESIRSVDFAARYGGEEFTIILFETGHTQAWETAERIRARVEQMRVQLDPNLMIAVTTSIGISQVCADDVAPDDLLQRADAALYQAKQAGRDQVCFAAAPERAPLVHSGTASSLR